MPLRLLAFLVLSAVSLPAQSSVWKITRGSQTLYLGGTIHLLRPTDFPLPPEFNAAYAASDKLYFETDASRLQSPELQMSLMSRGMFNDGKTLQDVISPEAWAAAKAHAKKTGLPLEAVSRMRPWLFVITLTVVELEKLGITSEGVDMHFYKKSLETKKTVGFFEAIEEQIEFIVGMGAGHESEMVFRTIEDVGELSTMMQDVTAAWRAGDVPEIDRLFLADWRKKYPAIYKSLLVDRNNDWLPKIDDLLKTPEIEFVLVGVGHLPGPDGLIAQLKARGCKLEQIKSAPAAPSASPAPRTKPPAKSP